MERVQNLIRFPEIPSIKLPKLPDQREIIKYLLKVGFNNPAVQKVGDFLVENGRLANYRDILVPLFETSEVVRDKIADLAQKYGIISEETPDLRKPQRLKNPLKSVKFDEIYTSRHANEETQHLPSQVDLFLCNPSNYLQEQNKVRRYKAGLLPQGANQVIEAATPEEIDGVKIRVAEYDDKIGKGIPIPEIVKHALKHPDRKMVICLTSIQTNQFTRALDVAMQLKAISLKLGLKLEILMGGPHIRTHEESVAKLIGLGIIPVEGEIEEGRFAEILADVMHGKLQKPYKYPLVENISDIPLPKPTKIKGYASAMSTLQISRGCPHKCRFCSTIGFDGRKMRYKSVEETEVLYRASIEEGIKTLFITDDNFLRNKNCRAILQMMAKVKEETGSDINLMFQSDLKVVKNGKIDTEFMDLCKKAGVFMIFFGQESFNPKVLTNQMGKRQNLVHIAKYYKKPIDKLTEDDVVEYTKMVVKEWKKREVAVNYTCIIGLEGDKPGCGKRIAECANKLGADIVTPFIYTLLPGSNDYENYVTSPNAAENRKKAGIKIVDLEFNNADSSHPNVEFENSLTKEQQVKEFLSLMRKFYKLDKINKKWGPSVLAYFLFHCLAAALGEHPMSLGLFRQENVERELSESRRRELESFIRNNSGIIPIVEKNPNQISHEKNHTHLRNHFNTDCTTNYSGRIL